VTTTRRSAGDAHPDLDALRRSEPAPERPRRPWLPRLTVAVLVLGAVAAVFAVLKPVLMPARDVTLRAVQVVGVGVTQASGTYVQAACWIEADPFPITVRPLVSGVVESLHVVEGTPVEAGKTLVAELRNLELENALEVAGAELTLADASRQEAATGLSVAESLLEQKIALRAAVAEREGELATARAAGERAKARRKAAEAALTRARIGHDAQKTLEREGHATPTALRTAAAAVAEAEERVAELRFEEVRVVADLGRITELLKIAREAARDPRDLQGRVDMAERTRAAREAAYQVARARRDVAQRNVEHLRVLAPADGVVLRLESAPGALVGPQGDFKGAGEGAGSTGQLNRMTGTLALLYDPQKLQARADVPFADLPGIQRGTRVEIEAKALPGRTFQGTVDRLVSEADITQAKLQLKIEVENPDALLRPEMLGTARFLVKPASGSSPTQSAPARVRVPSAALRGEAVFVYDPRGGGRARRVSVRVIEPGGDWTLVEGALGATSKVILEDVEDGEAVKASGGMS
jgi:multidrug efflux pump subunit AcrA (membrane-fusion protein)